MMAINSGCVRCGGKISGPILSEKLDSVSKYSCKYCPCLTNSGYNRDRYQQKRKDKTRATRHVSNTTNYHLSKN
uniref:Uncharacterized protein n=1 Tax=Tetranychus urticae TaxID=32264 RepID=T1JRS2_TETUR